LICPVWCVKDLDMHWRVCVAAGNNVAKLCQWAAAEGAHCALYWKYLFIFSIFFIIYHNPHYLWFVHPQVSSPHILLLIQNSATSFLIRCSFMIGLIFAKMDLLLCYYNHKLYWTFVQVSKENLPLDDGGVHRPLHSDCSV
jgi:hypothetical protein